MRSQVLSFLLFAALLAGCAAPPPLIAQTPSHRPEATFDNLSTKDVLGKMVGICLMQGAVIVNQTDYQLVCQKDMSPGDAVLAQILIGNRYSTTPVVKIRFNAAPIGNGVRVQTYQWIETQMAMGQVQTVEMNGNENFNSIQAKLLASGGHL